MSSSPMHKVNAPAVKLGNGKIHNVSHIMIAVCCIIASYTVAMWCTQDL
jgi:hypothetical protein